MRKYITACIAFLLLLCFVACMPELPELPQGQETIKQTERESEPMTEQQTDTETIKKETEQETQQETTDEETTYGPLHFPEETGE